MMDFEESNSDFGNISACKNSASPLTTEIDD